MGGSMRILRMTAVFCLLAGLAFAQQSTSLATDPTTDETSTSVKRPQSFDQSALDKTVNPCEDFYRFACGNWMKNNPIPADKSSWGRFNELTEYNRSVLHKILDDLSQQKNLKGNDQKLADYYGSCLDEKGIDAAGLKPLQPQLNAIARIKTKQELAGVLASMHETGARGLFTFISRPQLHDASKEGAWADQGGMGLPGKDFYTKTDPKSVEIRTKYVQHIANMFKLLGDPADKADAEAQTVMAIEMKLADGAMTPTDRRDTRKLDHWMTLAEFEKLAPAIDWNRYFIGLGAPKFAELNVAVPDFYKAVQGVVDTSSLDDLKTYLRWHLVHSNAAMMPTAFVNENFDFYGKVLSGAQQLEPRWNRCVQATDNDLGEALGQKYVQLTFGEHGKERTLAMVRQIEKEMETDIDQLEWMTPETKKAAFAKLHDVANKIGYPDNWRDYS
jgi:putative endopeptidase